jgi:two-component system catabolic regulation response regulator CreB
VKRNHFLKTAKQSVLVIEDEPAIADSISYALETEGISCIVATTGTRGLELNASEAPDLILLDIGLPDINGFDVCRQITSSSTTPVIFLTSRDSEIDQVLGLELGADDYITKPFSPRVLTARIRAKLRKRTVTATSAEATGFVDDTSAFKITLDGQALELSRYEYGLLSLFINNPGRLYSREQLMDLVWQEPESSFDRTVDTHVKTLRQKIKLIRADYDPIKTRRGLGYEFQA